MRDKVYLSPLKCDAYFRSNLCYRCTLRLMLTTQNCMGTHVDPEQSLPLQFVKVAMNQGQLAAVGEKSLRDIARDLKLLFRGTRSL